MCVQPAPRPSSQLLAAAGPHRYFPPADDDGAVVLRATTQNMFGGRNPLVPIGCFATAVVLCRGVLAMYQGDKILSQKMMRGRTSMPAP
jgi:hypothetical protein